MAAGLVPLEYGSILFLLVRGLGGRFTLNCAEIVYGVPPLFLCHLQMSARHLFRTRADDDEQFAIRAFAE